MEGQMQKKVQNVAIIGAGLMGFGIGTEYARFGYNVSFYNTNAKSSQQAMERAKEALDTMVKNRLIKRVEADATLKRIRPTTDIADAVKGADMAVESALEDLALKQDIFVKLDALLPPPIILATDTSSLRVTDITAKVKHPERTLATHYTQPPHFAPMVEVVAGEKTDLAVVRQVSDMLRKMHKMVILPQKDSPQFIQNRIQNAIARECMKLVDEGLGTPQTIDNTIMFGFGRRMRFTGYFKRLDLVGLDHTVFGARAKNFPVWGPLAEHVDKGEYGMKSGKGFYDWPPEKQKAFEEWYHAELIRFMKQEMERGDI
jgi:3-hydroxybutyryl-CoA dehydrogenase